MSTIEHDRWTETVISEYKIVEATSTLALELCVTARLAKGWGLVGGMSVHGRDIETFRQAMILHVLSDTLKPSP